MPAPSCRHAAAFALGAILAFAAPCLAATPETLTLSPTDTLRTWQTPLIGGTIGVDRGLCVENVTCDTVRIVLQPGDWTGKRIYVAIDWLVPASDWDLHTFRDRLDGPSTGSSTGFVPQNREAVPIAIDAVLTEPRVYVAQVVSASTVPEQVQGSVRVQAQPQARTAIRLDDPNFRFSPNVTVAAPATTRDCEPSLRVDARGNGYVGGIRGVPAGVDLWRFDLNPSSPTFDPQLRSPFYLGQPDAFAPGDSTGGRDGGGDIDIATSVPASPATVPIVTIVSLALANISSAVSTDRGDNFALSPGVANVPADDRQWIEATGANTVYLFYRAPIPATGLVVQRSDDHGATYPATALVSVNGTTPGYIDVDHATGYVYVSHHSDIAALVSRSTDQGATWKTFTVDNSSSHGHLFDPIKVGDDGTVYLTWSDGRAIHLTHSTDHGETWAPPVQVSGDETVTGLFPWLEAGSAGRVAVVWYASPSPVNWNSSDWRCYGAITTDAKANQPTFRIAEVSDHVIHASNLSEGGLTIPVVQEEPNRNLCDYFQVAIDPQGACVVAFTDDHNDYDGHTYVARQLAGPSLYASANGGTGTLVPVDPLPLPTPDPGLPEVSDFLHDATGNNLQVIPADNPYDILSIDYGCAGGQGGTALLETRMKLSAVTPLPANSFWRVNFAVNAPGPVADRGDQFYLLASTGNNPATPNYTFGTAVRDTAGTLVYTERGPASFGQVDATTNEIVIRLPIANLAPWVTHGPAPTLGTVMVGLRGHTGTLGTLTARDETRGGGSTTICPQLVGAPVIGSPAQIALGAPRPNPGRDGVTVALTLSVPAWVELGVFDSQGRRVRTVHAGTLPAGTATLRWDARSDAGHPVSSGIYFLRVTAGGEVRSQRTVLVR